MWGIYFTLAYLVVAIANEIQRPKEFDQEAKYSIMQTWKWVIILFEVAFISEIVITIFFWGLLYPDIESDSEMMQDGN
eukprot:CAMPEP_0170496652 /NCGR_PEP_ID=MMETSP0208-20121228/22287_1 /TAXON_ID=197538 /ORGANISM="Strombidium inclinatum, Strain S3" /LENGTH=77 /DNA_ID=CAMNT_0010773253 /DNA_START=288 /DNA_END=521 /DNA_ORIENTATION=+